MLYKQHQGCDSILYANPCVLLFYWFRTETLHFKRLQRRRSCDQPFYIIAYWHFLLAHELANLLSSLMGRSLVFSQDGYLGYHSNRDWIRKQPLKFMTMQHTLYTYCTADRSGGVVVLSFLQATHILKTSHPGGTQIWVRQGCAAPALKPIPIFKGDFGQKGTHF